MDNKNLISIPELSLVIMIGASGSGKTSFAHKYFKATEILSSDSCRALVSDDENNQDATDDAFDVLFFIASKRLAAGKMVVVDATNVQPESRKKLVELARKYHVIPVAIVLNTPQTVCAARNLLRPNRQFNKHVVTNQYNQLQRSIKHLHREGIRYVYTLTTDEEINNSLIVRTPLWNNKKQEHGPFDIIGDIHGCFDELVLLLENLGYTIQQGDAGFVVTHPDNRKIIFVGDLVDRGPKTPATLRLVMDTVRAGVAFCVVGNHDDKLKRALQGSNVTIAHGLAESLEQLKGETPAFKKELITFFEGLISHYVFDDGKLAVAHAGLKEEYIGRGSAHIRDFCMFGEVTGEIDTFGLPVRYPWASEYRGETMIVYGHTPVPEAEWINNTINVDTGCVFGGKLSALRYPEKEIVSVPAAQVYYEPIRPLQVTAATRSENTLDINDVIGKRIITTSLHHTVTIQEENACAALEVMSRFAIDPRWLIYLPPTMSPTDTTNIEGLLEHPHEIFSYYRNRGVQQVICQEKHMGSRALVVICKDTATVQKRFGIESINPGICYTRTGRNFFDDAATETLFLNRIQNAVSKAGLWEKHNTDWFLFDGELMPWSAKAQDLLKDQYAAVGACATQALQSASSLLAHTPSSIEGVAQLHQHFNQRADTITRYQGAYRAYCWPVATIDDYKFAPFHILAHEGNNNMQQDHLWHLDSITQLCSADPKILRTTQHLLVNTEDADSCAQAITWWTDLTSKGGEGMVVKPLGFTVQSNKGLLQPGIKCRGREYLRIIYGPEYTLPEHMARLRSRNVSRKRSLALREYALGHEALQRFVNREPLYRVHEAVFGVLALESEPIDPRL